jgi:hypothetical protein
MAYKIKSKKVKEKNVSYAVDKKDYLNNTISASVYQKELESKGFVRKDSSFFEAVRGRHTPSLSITTFINPISNEHIAVFSQDSWYEPLKEGKRAKLKNIYGGREFGALVYSTKIGKDVCSEDLYDIGFKKENEFEEKQRTLFKSWGELTLEEKREVTRHMRIGHIKNNSEASGEYEKFRTFWGVLK